VGRCGHGGPSTPREIGHHPDIDIRWQRIRFAITTHDAGNRITAADFDLARHIDEIAAGHGAKPVTGVRYTRSSRASVLPAGSGAIVKTYGSRSF
jgi:hypothetical protein